MLNMPISEREKKVKREEESKTGDNSTWLHESNDKKTVMQQDETERIEKKM
jgi:hypothetical protein